MQSDQEASKFTGITTVCAKAIQTIAMAVVTQRISVPREHIKVSNHDDRGLLGIDISCPINSQVLEIIAKNPDTSIFSLAEQARDDIVQRISTLAGLKVGRVNLRLCGLYRHREGRKLK